METKKQEIVVINELITEQAKKYKDADHEQGYDRRKKEWKAFEKIKEGSEKAIREEVLRQARAHLEANRIDLKMSAVEFELKAYAGLHRYEDAPEPNINIYSDRSNYHNMNIEYMTIDELKTWMNEKNEEKAKTNNAEGLRRIAANKLLKEVEVDVTYKDYSYGEKDEPWKGREMSCKWEGKDDWNESAEVKMCVDAENKIASKFEFRAEFKTIAEAKNFWEKAKEFVTSQSNYAKKVRR